MRLHGPLTLPVSHCVPSSGTWAKQRVSVSWQYILPQNCCNGRSRECMQCTNVCVSVVCVCVCVCGVCVCVCLWCVCVCVCLWCVCVWCVSVMCVWCVWCVWCVCGVCVVCVCVCVCGVCVCVCVSVVCVCVVCVCDVCDVCVVCVVCVWCVWCVCGVCVVCVHVWCVCVVCVCVCAHIWGLWDVAEGEVRSTALPTLFSTGQVSPGQTGPTDGHCAIYPWSVTQAGSQPLCPGLLQITGRIGRPLEQARTNDQW